MPDDAEHTIENWWKKTKTQPAEAPPPDESLTAPAASIMRALTPAV